MIFHILPTYHKVMLINSFTGGLQATGYVFGLGVLGWSVLLEKVWTENVVREYCYVKKRSLEILTAQE